MLGMLANLFKVLNSDAAPGQIALGFACALFIGLTPFLSLHNFVILFLVLSLRINLTAFLLASGVFSLIAYFIDPLSISLGQSLLINPDLQIFWTQLYQSEFWQATKFNHTLLLGSLTISVIAFLPVLLVSRVLIKVYRERFMIWFEKLKISKIIKASKFYKLYSKVGA
jgi:uncharacterized protein (TIGR03546 family)